jgi:hypothetical protein
VLSDEQSSDDTGRTDGVVADPPSSQGELHANRTGIHRLDKTEYQSTMLDLLGVTATPTSIFSDAQNFSEVFALTDARFEQYFNATDTLVDRVFADATLRGRIMICTPTASSDTACMGQIISTFGARAWRRPLVDIEVSRLTELATDAIALGEDTTGGIKQVVKAMLSSASFLYRVEMDPNPGVSQ